MALSSTQRYIELDFSVDAMNEEANALDAEHLLRVEEAFNQIAKQTTLGNLSPEETSKLLGRFCGDNARLRDEVKDLIGLSEERLDGFMDSGDEAVSTVSQFPGLTVLRQIGEGGMGAVFLAEQETPQRLVAVKTLKSIFSNRNALDRFQREADVLARLHHPNIAQIFSVGTVEIQNPAGLKIQQPYLVMEYVDGVYISQFCQKNDLGTHEKLELMQQLCQAIDYAHQKGVVHRDLKPANTLVNQSCQIKVLDFGIAKLVRDESRSANALSTETGSLMGTLPYMSPEQLAGDSSIVGPVSDVYSLGAILFELLTGQPPLQLSGKDLLKSIQTASMQVVRRIGDIDPRFKGDLEIIVAKSLAKERDERYQSAEELAEDIRRFRLNFPIQAKPPSVIDRLGKLTRRHPAKALLAPLVVFVLTICGWSVYSSNRLVQQSRISAQEQSDLKTKIADILNKEVLSRANPFSAQQANTVQGISDALEQALADQAGNDRHVDLAIRVHLAQTLMGQGDYRGAESQLLRARRFFEKEAGKPADAIQVELMLASQWLAQWRLEEVESSLKRISGLIRNHGASLPEINAQWTGLAASLEKSKGNLSESEALYREALRLWDTLIETDWQGDSLPNIPADPIASRATCLHNFADCLLKQGRYDESEKNFRETIAQRTRVLPKDHPLTLVSRHSLANVLWRQSGLIRRTDPESAEKKLDQSRKEFNEILASRTHSLGNDHPHTIGTIYGLALVEESAGNLAKAESLYLKSYEGYHRCYGTDQHMEVLHCLNGIGTSRVRQGKHLLAVESFEKAYDAGLKLVGKDHPKTNLFHNNLMICLEKEQSPQAVADLYKKYEPRMSVAQETLTKMVLARSLLLNKRYAEAIEVQLALCKQLETSSMPATKKAEAYRRLANYYEASKQPDEAKASRLKAAEHQNQNTPGPLESKQ